MDIKNIGYKHITGYNITGYKKQFCFYIQLFYIQCYLFLFIQLYLNIPGGWEQVTSHMLGLEGVGTVCCWGKEAKCAG